MLLDLRKQCEAFGHVSARTLGVGDGGQGRQLPPSTPPPREALTDLPLAPHWGCEQGRETAPSGGSNAGGGGAFYHALVRKAGRESPLGLFCPSEGLVGRQSSRLCCGSLPRALALAVRAPAAAPSDRGWETRSPPVAPVTSSCFCLALRGSLCPNPRPLPWLHLLQPLPPPPRLPSPPPPLPKLRSDRG